MTPSIPRTYIGGAVASDVPGSAPLRLKTETINWFKLLAKAGPAAFGYNLRRRLELKEVSLEPSRDDHENQAVKIVCELEVTPDMCNAEGVVEHGAMTFLMDEGSAVSLLMMKMLDGQDHTIGVSQNFNFFWYNVPPGPGSKLTIISRSVNVHGDMGCCQCEIWDMEKHKMIVSGTQTQMLPSKPENWKKKPKL
ncbi:hypothetical protein CPC08DRAFT_706654 [Agrocybe pediades]|nr:hypothetical protein CPC08DRAFT_706654 [Agrocybe pediades]